MGSLVTSEWSISIWEAMKFLITDIIVPSFLLLDSIPLGAPFVGTSGVSVLDFMIGIGIIALVAGFFWRASSGGSIVRGFSGHMKDKQENSTFHAQTYGSNVPREKQGWYN